MPSTGITTDAIEQLKQDFISCKLDWELYQNLFMHSAPRVNSLNKLCGPFFGRIQRNLMENTMVRIARLTDPYCDRKKGKTNLTLGMLAEHGSHIFGLKERYDKIMASVATIRNYRHKVLAHRDYDIATHDNPKTKLSALKLKSLTFIISMIQEFINAYCESEQVGNLVFPKAIDIEPLLAAI